MITRRMIISSKLIPNLLLSRSIHLYYDTACMLITLVQPGKLLEGRAKDQVLEGLQGLLSLMPTRVRITGEPRPVVKKPGDPIRRCITWLLVKKPT